MEQIFTIFRNFCGSGIYPYLFFAALVYLLFTEKNKIIRWGLVDTSIVLTFLFFFPPFYRLMEKLDAGTYYRFLWLLPMTVVIAYAAVKLIGKYTRTGFVLMALLLILSGQYVYDNANITKTQNRFHIPDSVVAICNEIMPEEGEERIFAAFPQELLQYVRQYSTEIQMPYGREVLVPAWGTAPHPMYEEMEKQVIDAEAIGKMADDYFCHYVILNRGKEIDGDMKGQGLELIAQIDAYDVYRNVSAEIWKEE